MKQELIKSIHVDSANLEHIAKTGNINGTLLTEISRVMDEYKQPREQYFSFMNEYNSLQGKEVILKEEVEVLLAKYPKSEQVISQRELLIDFLTYFRENEPLEVAEISDNVDNYLKSKRFTSQVDFGMALKALNEGKKIKVPEWKGYWFKESGMVKVMTAEGEKLETPHFQQYIFRTDWIIFDSIAKKED